MSRIKKFSSLAILLLCSCHLALHGQIMLAPSFVFIDESSGVGNLYISNDGTEPQEVAITFKFGYPDSDSAGNLVMNYNDKEAYRQFGLDSVIRAFPRAFVLPGKSHRIVRIQVIPGKIRNDGFYYTRMKVLSKPQAPEMASEPEEGLSASINLNFEQVTAVFYRRGKVNTGVVMQKLDISQNEKKLELRPHLQRTGNAPFFGTMAAQLRDDNSKVVAEVHNTTTAYFDVVRRMELDIGNVKPGDYTLELSFESRRNDMQAGDLIQSPRVVHKTKVAVR
jgi:P pilus assembly chaperone PapD